MNLLAVAPNGSKLFVASGDTLISYDLGSDGRPVGAGKQEEIGLQADVNQVRLQASERGSQLILVSDSGQIRVLDPQRVGAAADAVLCLENEPRGISTWGIAARPEHGLLAVSANSHQITLFSREAGPADAERPPEAHRYGAPVLLLPPHEHNIPSLDLTEDGRLLASCSIDCSVRVWCLRTRCLLAMHRPSQQWAWAVRVRLPCLPPLALADRRSGTRRSPPAP
jgi:WD40 repeat protein